MKIEEKDKYKFSIRQRLSDRETEEKREIINIVLVGKATVVFPQFISNIVIKKYFRSKAHLRICLSSK